MKYKHITVNINPKPLEVILGDDNIEYKEAKAEEAIALAGADLLALLKSSLFHLESIAHLRGMEQEILPFVDAARDKMNCLIRAH